MKRFIKNFAIYLVIFAVVLGVAFFYKGADGAKKTAEVKFSTFATHLEKGKYKTINITDRKMTATLKNGNKEYAYAPSVVEISWLENSYVFPQVKSGKLKLSSDPPQSSV
ncbi:MAG: ATP-dependent metallopeptidase FtsH/Yme1/Tma family protein, partial [Mogibacterium sp.]|nr:ATP-dependent metallopeptidase FtsH/Yme1/Tma family protein [Mogibacterium sp.]